MDVLENSKVSVVLYNSIHWGFKTTSFQCHIQELNMGNRYILNIKGEETPNEKKQRERENKTPKGSCVYRH